jgi:alginate O-acetyltransferase complex protein AlgI
MVLTSIEFALLLALTFILYYSVGERLRKTVLLLASCIFIGYGSPYFLLTAVGISSLTYVLGLRLSAEQGRKSLGWIYLAGVVLLVGAWTFFRHSGIIIPMGISFYTFQALSYLTEVYWGEYEAERNYWNFSLFMLLFMKFLSGPIERPSTLLPQVQKCKGFDYVEVTYGLKLIFLGLAKKLILADNLAIGVDAVFHIPQDNSGIQLLLATLIYPIQLYADFSGYTDMAIGAARLFGIKLSPNFNRPFTAITTSDLWRRWHMSLSFWVRDYLFIPLTAYLRGWNKTGIYLSLFITFGLLGVWHGTGTQFVIYGLIQGAIICYEMNVRTVRRGILHVFGNSTGRGILMVRTYLLFAFSLVFFRAESLKDAVYIISHISFGIRHSWKELSLGATDHTCIVVAVALLLMWLFEYYNAKRDLLKAISERPAYVRWTIYYLLVIALFTTGKFNSNDFIYLQF